MAQSTAIFAALIIAFVIFVTVRGHLPNYLRLVL